MCYAVWIGRTLGQLGLVVAFRGALQCLVFVGRFAIFQVDVVQRIGVDRLHRSMGSGNCNRKHSLLPAQRHYWPDEYKQQPAHKFIDSQTTMQGSNAHINNEGKDRVKEVIIQYN